jgi:hypothetical protein
MNKRKQYEFLWVMEDNCRISGRWSNLFKEEFDLNRTDLVVWPGLLFDVQKQKGWQGGGGMRITTITETGQSIFQNMRV